MNFLVDILEDLKSRFESKFTTNDFQLKRQLSVLDEFEKMLIRKKILGKFCCETWSWSLTKYFLELDYNIGALKVIKVLKECEILNVTDYLLSKPSEEDQQGIIADIIDLDETQLMLKEVILSTRTSAVISTQFHQCFSQYTYDVINRPDLIKNEFISGISRVLSSEDFRELVIVRFMSEEHNDVDLAQVFSCQKEWNLKFLDGNLQLVTEILRQIAAEHSESMVKFVMKQLQSESKQNWFFMLLILKLVDRESKGVKDLKSNFYQVSKTFNSWINISLRFSENFF